MKLDKAIEINLDLLTDAPQYPPDDRREAVKLGIEALKIVRDERHFGVLNSIRKLPGEDAD